MATLLAIFFSNTEPVIAAPIVIIVNKTDITKLALIPNVVFSVELITIGPEARKRIIDA